MKKFLLILGFFVVGTSLFLFYFSRNTTSTISSYSCGNGTSLLFKETISNKVDIENGPEYSSYLAYNDKHSERFIDSYQGDTVFPAYLKVSLYKKFSSIDNERSISGMFERTNWNIWVSEKRFSVDEYNNIQKCLADNLGPFNASLNKLPYPLQITSVSFVPLGQELSNTTRPFASWEISGSVVDFSCPAVQGFSSSEVSVDKRNGEVHSSEIWEIGFIDASGSFKKFFQDNSLELSQRNQDFLLKVNAYVNILPLCKNTGGKNIYEYYSERYP